MSVSALTSVNQWSRFLGVSLRPWSGYSPLSLILRGLIHLAVCGFFLVLVRRFGSGDEIIGGEAELAFLGNLVSLATIVLAVLVIIAAARIVVGVLDLVPRSTVTGVVQTVRERKVGDFLPRLVQRRIFARNPTNLDRRKIRTEVVLLTDAGERHWTVRNRKTARLLQPGSRMRVTVSPLVGYVAAAEPVSVTSQPHTPNRN